MIIVMHNLLINVKCKSKGHRAITHSPRLLGRILIRPYKLWAIRSIPAAGETAPSHFASIKKRAGKYASILKHSTQYNSLFLT